MARAASPTLIRDLGALFEAGTAAGLSDRQLLERIAPRGGPPDESAFAAIVARHGPMVLTVCRQLLGDAHHAEDAFQAVFLVLARGARSIRDPDRLAAWLHGVARRTSRRARARIGRHRRDDLRAALHRPEARPDDPLGRMLDRERAEAMHLEIARLPAAFRTALVLCDLEGVGLDEAARGLGWPVGTLRSRLARARQKLHDALARRGFAPATVTVWPVAAPLCEATARAALRFVAGPGAATTLAREVLRSMMVQRLGIAAMAALIVGVVAAGAGSLVAAGREAVHPAATTPGAPRPDSPPDQPAPGRMFVVGRVLDPDGKPVPNASVRVEARRKLMFGGMSSEGVHAAPIGQAASDASGRFRLDIARTSSAHHTRFVATAIATGYGVGFAELDPDEVQPSADIALRPEQVVEGRLFDVQGHPVAGVPVSVSSVWHDLPRIDVGQGRLLEKSEGASHPWGRVHDLPGWPRPATTDAEGRFTLRGIGGGGHATLSVLDPRFAPQTIDIDTDAPGGVKTLKAAIQPARVLTGRVTYADDGRPVARARVGIRVSVGEGGIRSLPAEADADGRFRIRPMPGDRLVVTAGPPDGQPYFAIGKELAWPGGAIEQAVDLALPRGVLIRGIVSEEGTGRPVAEAAVHFFPSAPRPARTGGGGLALTAADGSFAMAVGPHPGHLSVQAAGEDYQLRTIGGSEFYDGARGGKRLYAHAFLACDPGKVPGPLDIRVALRRGASVAFLLIGPDGQPARDVRVFSRAVLGPTGASTVRAWPGALIGDVAPRGRFAVHGLDDETEVPVHFLQPESRLGATVRVSGKMAARGPITVRLEPCGQATARLVGPDGQPITGLPRGLGVTMVATPGPPLASATARAGALAADEALLSRIDPLNHVDRMVADAQGRIRWPALIPGATYRITERAGDGPQVRREFAVGPGEAADLGDIPVQKPPG